MMNCITYKWRRVQELGLSKSLVTLASALARRIFDHRTGLVYMALPTEWRAVIPRLGAHDVIAVHHNRPEDLLLWSGGPLSTASAISECASDYPNSLARGRDLHTLVLNGQLAGWGYSYLPSEPARLSETPGAILDFLPESVSLYDFHVIPAFRGRRLYQYLLSEILKMRFAEGARHAYIGVLASNGPSRSAIERVGFRLAAINHYRRFFRREKVWTEHATDTPNPITAPLPHLEE